jgi:hypothetical protein
MVCFAPKGWPGKGPGVCLGIPECELVLSTLRPDGEPLALVIRPEAADREISRWIRRACGAAASQQAFMLFNCNTAEQADMAAARAACLLPGYRRVALERMYDPAARMTEKLS